MSDTQALDHITAWRASGHKAALATVVQTWGSSPRVINAAREVMASGKSQILEFGVTNEMAWDVGLACGGKVRVFVDAVE